MDSARRRVVVVTGAGHGLGRALALRFARDGAAVALLGRSGPPLEELAREIAAGRAQVVAVPADVTDEKAVGAAHARVVEQLGPADVVVANAGIAGATAPLWEQSLEDWERTMAVNVRGVFLVCRAFVPSMRERGAGAVVVIGSMTGKRPMHGRTPYAASKTALIGLVRTLAWELGDRGVRINLISPGAIAGPRLDAVIDRQSAAADRSAGDVRAGLEGLSPLGRFVEVSEVVDAAVFLASDAASAITGEDLNVSAGAVPYG